MLVFHCAISDLQRKLCSFVIHLVQVGQIQINPPTDHAPVQEQWNAACGVFDVRSVVVSHLNIAMLLPPLVHFHLIMS